MKNMYSNAQSFKDMDDDVKTININLRDSIFRIVAIVLPLICITLALENQTNLKYVNQERDYLMDELRWKDEQILEIRRELKEFKELSDINFESNWKSFSTIRQNFIALGHGFHLNDSDIYLSKKR